MKRKLRKTNAGMLLTALQYRVITKENITFSKRKNGRKEIDILFSWSMCKKGALHLITNNVTIHLRLLPKRKIGHSTQDV